MKKQLIGSLSFTIGLLVSLSLVLCFTAKVYAVPTTYYFEELSFDSSNGFKTVDDKFLVSEEFYSYSGWCIFYSEGVSSASGIIIKPDGQNLASFDLVDMYFSYNDYVYDIGFVELEIEATLNTGLTVTRSVDQDFDYGASLIDLGMGMSSFDDVTQLSFSIKTNEPGIEVWDLEFSSITIDDENPPPEMRIEWYGTDLEIPDGDTTPRSEDGTDFGSADIATGKVVRAFDIINTGSGRLTLTGGSPYVTLRGDTSDFSLKEAPEKSIIPGGELTRFKIEFNPTKTGTKTATVSIANDDADENPYNFKIEGNAYEKAKVVYVTSTNADDSYGDGAVINITVEFNTDVKVSGTPQLALETGVTDAVASYKSGTGTDTLTFRYTVGSTHRSSDLSYKGTGALALNGGTIKGVDGGDDATLTLPASGNSGSLSYNKDLNIITPGFLITETESETLVGESGLTDTFTVVLTARPDSDVVINVSCDDLTEAMVDLDALTFTRNTWNTAQTVKVLGVNDSGDDGNIESKIKLSIDDGASDNAFDSLANQTIDVMTIDDDRDTDNDGMPDEWEKNHGLDPDDPDDDEADNDNDGVSNLDEFRYGTDPNEEDSDNDGLSDQWEIANGYDPTIVDSDDNGIDDGDEDPDGDGVSNMFEEMLGLAYDNSDSDGDGIEDGDEDPDGDGITTIVEIDRGLDPGVNELPTVIIAQPEQTVDEDVEVILNGSASFDQDDGIRTYLWAQTTGLDTAVSIANADKANASFVSPQVDSGGGLFKFSLTIKDNAGQSSSSTCIVNVTWDNNPPVADAGTAQEVNAGDMVQLDGSNSIDADGEIISYLWEQIEGTAVENFDSASATPSFTAPYLDEDESLVFRLTVTDQNGLASVAVIEITVLRSGAVATDDGGGGGGGGGCFIRSALAF